MAASPPAWLQDLADAAALLMTPADVMSPIGCHVFCDEQIWEVTLFASSTEIVGGSHDGQLRQSRFVVDVQALVSLLTVVEDVSWQAHALASDDELGPHLAVAGWCGEHQVCLRILSEPPLRFGPGRRAIVYAPLWEETW